MSKIPKRIWQTWKIHDVPEDWKRSPESIKEVMPKWHYFLYDDKENEEFVAEHFPHALNHYKSFRFPIQRADFIRACRLYVHGGVYCDLDFEFLAPLDDLFKNGSELYLIDSKSYLNALMASAPKHPFWLEYINEMMLGPQEWAVGKHLEVMSSTGPLALRRVLNSTTHVYSMLPQKLVMPCSICEFGTCNKPGMILRPLKGGSWNSWDSCMYNYFKCFWKEIILVLFLLILVWLMRRKTTSCYL